VYVDGVVEQAKRDEMNGRMKMKSVSVLTENDIKKGRNK
jgi:hypothetical protein